MADEVNTCKATLVGDQLPGNGKWKGCVLAADGNIYGIPGCADQVLCFDPRTQQAKLVGEELPGNFKWAGGVLAADGNIYGIPSGATQVLLFDPRTQESTLVGAELPGDHKWDGGVLAADGNIYGIPLNATQVLRFDPRTQQATLVGAELPGDSKWQGGVLAADGNIYGIPSAGATQVLRFDPRTQQATLVGAELPGDGKWCGGVLAADGNIYGIPHNATQVLRFDPRTQQATLVGNQLPGGSKWQGGVLAADGNIYGIPVKASQVLRFDPRTQEATLVGDELPPSNNKWLGGVLAGNNIMYSIPWDAKQVLRITPPPPKDITEKMAALWLLRPLEALTLDADELRRVTAAAVVFCRDKDADSFANLEMRGLFEDLTAALGLEVVPAQRFLKSLKAQAKVVTAAAVETAATKAAQATDAAAAAKGLNDNAHGIDRFGYRPLAQALAAMLKRAEPPVCVGLYARWGSGKTFMISLLKKEFDPTIREDPKTRRLFQFFEKGYEELAPKLAPPEKTVISLICGLLLTILVSFLWIPKAIFPTMPYGVTTLFSVIWDAFVASQLGEAFCGIPAWCSELKRSCWKTMAKTGNSDLQRPEMVESEHTRTLSGFRYNRVPKQEDPVKKTSAAEKEFIFVDFNAWEFADSDALWAGLVRGVFLKVEERVAAGKREWNETEKCFKPSEHSKDFRREWRVRRAKKHLIERFGLPSIFRVVTGLAMFVLALVALICCELLEVTHIFVAIGVSLSHPSFAAIPVAVIGLLLGAVVSFTWRIILPLTGFFSAISQETRSPGDVIFKQASVVKDQIGFIAAVKQELAELFNYLHEFDPQIVIVPIIDDLDRCITDGRNVKVLEAMQLVLSVPGAPIISFLAFDSRLVVASIEDHYEKVFAKTNISGYEYLDKIVQLPFALPEPAPDKVERLISKSLEGDAASPVQVAQRLKVFGVRGRQIMNAIGSNQVTFKMDQTAPSPKNVASLAPRTIEPLVLTIEKFWGDDYELESEQALELVCAAAGELSATLKELVANLKEMDQTNVYKEEAIEVLCRATNTALEAGKLGFGEDANLQDQMHPLQDEGTLSRDGNFENLFGRKKPVIEKIKKQDLKGTLSARLSFSTTTASSAATSSVAASSASSSATAFSSSATVVESENFKAQNFARPKEKDENGRLLLHVAAMQKGPFAALTELLDAYPEAIAVKDNDGKLPFDLAVKSGCSVQILALLQPDSVAWLDGGEGFQQPDRPLVSAAESRVFESLARLLDPNPRRLKRIISMYALVTEVAKRVPLSEGSLEFVKDDSRWANLRPKLAKWLCLCENYPYRMSFLVLVLIDREHKEMVNRLRYKHPAHARYGLVHYGKGGGKAAASATADADEPSLELPDDMPIVEAYFRHVERDIYSHPKARKMLSLDGDPEMLTALLMQPVADLSMTKAGKDDPPTMCDITVADILGPLLKEEGTSAKAADRSDRARDANFSLLSYSFNLNPALRHELSFEMGQMHSDTALYYGATDDMSTPKPVLPQTFYSKAPPRFTCVQNFGVNDDDVGGSKPVLPREGKSI